MEKVVIRQATGADVLELAELRRTFTFEDSTGTEAPRADFDESFARIVSEGIESGRWVVWLAEVDAAIVSHAFVGLIEKIPRPIAGQRAIGYVTNVYTVPAFRGRGIGGHVIEATTAWASESDVELLVVWPSDTSIAYYERHGFADRGEPLVWLHPDHPA